MYKTAIDALSTGEYFLLFINDEACSMNTKFTALVVASLVCSSALAVDPKAEAIFEKEEQTLNVIYVEARNVNGIDKDALQKQMEQLNNERRERCGPIKNEVEQATCLAKAASSMSKKLEEVIEEKIGIDPQSMPRNYIKQLQIMDVLAVNTVASYYEYPNGVAYIKSLEDFCWEGTREKSDYYQGYLCALRAFMGSILEAREGLKYRRLSAPIYQWANVENRVLEEFEKSKIDKKYAQAMIGYANAHHYVLLYPAMQNAGMR
jgi:hypothetical protein